MFDKTSDMLISVFAADAFSLKAEWIYDFGKVDTIIESTKDELAAHPEKGYLTGKEAGEFSHYGDHVRNLLGYLVSSNRQFSLDTYSAHWSNFFDTYNGYKDHASKAAFKRLSKEVTSFKAPKKMLADMAGASRFAPLVLLHPSDAEALTSMAQSEAGCFYNSPFITDSISLGCFLVVSCLKGEHPFEALGSKDAPISDLIRPLVEGGLESVQQDTRLAIEKFGNACGIDGSLPGIIHLIAKYKDDPIRGHHENLRAGGDISGRSLLYSMAMGAFFGVDSVRKSWIDGLQDLEAIRKDISFLLVR